METRAIGELEDGEEARVEGTVRAATGRSLRSPVTERACLYFDVRDGLDAEARERESLGFWVEDASGRVFVPGEAIEVDARAERGCDVVDAASADYQAVSDRLRDLKDRMRDAQGSAASALRKEREQLAKVATLLCAVTAQARGKVHLGGTLHSQERWIRKHAHLAEGGPGATTIQLAFERWEVVIAEGDAVALEGCFRVEPLPPGVGAGGGYRSRPTCLVARPGSDGVLHLRGVGASASHPDAACARLAGGCGGPRSDEGAVEAPTRDPVFERRVLTTLSILAVVGGLLWWWLRG
ncbi:MAG TPA: hypothetical protein RMH99_16235 [Sandaracinaceae bacterium LLY-WYZ-13_1]|nr:hypothetical protein [Sandaracinaceae bacterium LLY-WYZ-13_1]